MLIARLRNRITKSESEGGFTLIELLVVVIIIGILLAIAVPSYLKFRDRAAVNAAKANVRAAIPAVEAFYADKGTYTNMTIAALKADYDAGLKISAEPVISADGKKYCIQSTSDGTSTGTNVHHVIGPGGSVAANACPETVS